jgi:predicted O-linked N-acetylglucosamine transferase (SPINDLY family)
MASAADLLRQALTSFQQGRPDQAERPLRQVLRKEPSNLAALNILGVVLTAQKKYAEAEPHLKSALKINATSDATHYNYGLVLKALGRPDEALERLTQAIAINPRNADSWNTRGTVLNDLKDHAAAISDFDKAITLNPNFSAAFFHKGKSLAELKGFDEALAAYDRALALNPNTAEAWFGRGFVFHQLHRHDDAVRAYARALQLDPQLPFLKGNLLHEKMLSCDWQDVERLTHEIESDIAAGKLAAEPFGWQGIATSQRSLQLCAERFNQTRFPARVDEMPAPPPAANGKIRIGYVSGEFREQATSLLMVGVLEQHDRERFEILAVDNGWSDQSETRRRIESAVNIIPIRHLNDPQAAAAIRDHQIDILVNLNGYFGEERTRVFARRPAPIQVNYLGFPGTMGAPYMDYIIADRQVLPDEHRAFYSEKVVWLPNSYQANDRNKTIASKSFSRAECGLPEHGFVFCCFNNIYKVTPEIFAHWMKILKRVDGSVLWLVADNAAAVANLKREAEGRGVAGDRLIFADRRPPPEHLARHRCADLFLDTLPYNAHTTASDALWAGLPLVTCVGPTFAGKVAASLLHAVRLPELITSTLEDYENLAVELATSPGKLANLRQKLADHRLTTPLFDTALFTRHLEAAYTTIYQRLQAGLGPDHLAVAG